MKHFLYAFYVLFYATAVFLAGLFAGQLVERKNTKKKNLLSPMNISSNGVENGNKAKVGGRSKVY